MLRRLFLFFRRFLQAFWNLLKRRDSDVVEANPSFDPDVLIFFNLPDVALKQLFSKIDACYIFHFATLFPELQPRLRQPLTITECKINLLGFWIELRRNGGIAAISLVTQSEKQYQQLKDSGREEKEISGIQYLYSSYPGHLDLIERSVGPWGHGLNPKSLEWMCRILLDWFQFESLTFKVNRRKLEVILPILVENKNRLRKLVVKGCSHEPELHALNFADCLRYLGDVKCDELELEWEPSCGENKYYWKLNQRKIVLRQSTWLPIDSLLTMDCAVFHCFEVKLTASEMKMFIGKWMDGGLEQLELLELHGLLTDWSTVLDGLEIFEVKVGSMKEIRTKDGKKRAVFLCLLVAFCFVPAIQAITLEICQMYCASVNGGASYDNCSPWISFANQLNTTCYNLCVHNCHVVYDGSCCLNYCTCKN